MEATVKVALPGWMLARRGPWSGLLDVTALVEEWAVGLLDPVGVLRRHAAKALEYPGWDLCGKATVSAATMRLLREAAADRDVLEAVSQSRYAPLVSERLGAQATCLLLGLAATTALDAYIGKAASSVRADVKKRYDQAARTSEVQRTSERQRSKDAPSEDAAAERPVRVSRPMRPILSPLPADLRQPPSGEM